MKTYDLTYIVSTGITSKEAEAKAKEIESYITSKEGTIVKNSNPSAKTLSYPIGGNASGFIYGSLEFQIEPEKLLEVKIIIDNDPAILRNMIVIKQPAEFKKSKRFRLKSNLESSGENRVEKNTEDQTTIEETKEEETKEEPKKVKEQEKVELKDIENELDEILGE